MIFKSINIKEGMFSKVIDFSEDANLIFSNNNSVGKTTLLRLILFSLGFQIPSTKGLDFKSCAITTKLTIDKGEVVVSRKREILDVSINGENIEYVLPYQLNDFHSDIFSTKNIDLIKNILGVIYFDQDKGWTLLNRGKVIGNIKFNIEELVRGLADRNCVELVEELSRVEQDYSKYKQMFDVANYQEEIMKLKGDVVFDSYEEEISKEISILSFDKNIINSKIKKLDTVITNNNKFINFVETMSISVEGNNNEIIPVNKDTIVDYEDNTEFLLAKRRILKVEFFDLEKKINKLKNSIDIVEKLVDSETVIQNFDKEIMQLDINSAAVDEILKQLNKKRVKLKSKLSKITKENNYVIEDIHKNIMKYAEELGLTEYISPEKDYIFTNELKHYSGTILHELVFIFRLSYILALENKLSIKLPIIIDSPSGREVNKINVTKMMEILKRDFNKNQLIIASINKYNFENIKIININDRLLEFEGGSNSFKKA